MGLFVAARTVAGRVSVPPTTDETAVEVTAKILPPPLARTRGRARKVALVGRDRRVAPGPLRQEDTASFRPAATETAVDGAEGRGLLGVEGVRPRLDVAPPTHAQDGQTLTAGTGGVGVGVAETADETTSGRPTSTLGRGPIDGLVPRLPVLGGRVGSALAGAGLTLADGDAAGGLLSAGTLLQVRLARPTTVRVAVGAVEGRVRGRPSPSVAGRVVGKRDVPAGVRQTPAVTGPVVTPVEVPSTRPGVGPRLAQVVRGRVVDGRETDTAPGGDTLDLGGLGVGRPRVGRPVPVVDGVP